MGKSKTGELLQAIGLPVLDTDTVARQIVEPGQPALEEIRQKFGEQLIGRDGRLIREELARIVFADPEKRQLLESILHPRIRTVWLGQMDRWRAGGEGGAAVIIPLLFETNASSEFTATICVACSATTQTQRLAERGWAPQQIRARLASQWPIEEKMQAADFVAWTEGSVEVLSRQLKKILAYLSL